MTNTVVDMSIKHLVGNTSRPLAYGSDWLHELLELLQHLKSSSNKGRHRRLRHVTQCDALVLKLHYTTCLDARGKDGGGRGGLKEVVPPAMHCTKRQHVQCNIEIISRSMTHPYANTHTGMHRQVCSLTQHPALSPPGSCIAVRLWQRGAVLRSRGSIALDVCCVEAPGC